VHVGEAVAVRDSKEDAMGLDRTVLEFAYDQWQQFLAGEQSEVRHEVLADGSVQMWSVTNASERLAFDADEWTAFLAGVEAGEFTREFAALHP
jgi:hypothetical protein